MFILGLITGILISLLNVVLVYVFRAKIHQVIAQSPVTQKGEILELEDPLEHVKKMLIND